MSLRRRISNFIQQDRGFVLTTEAVLWSTVLVIGLVVGIAVIRYTVAGAFVKIAVGIASKADYEFKQHPHAMHYAVRTTGSLLDPEGAAADMTFGTYPGLVEKTPARHEGESGSHHGGKK